MEFSLLIKLGDIRLATQNFSKEESEQQKRGMTCARLYI